MIKSAPAKALSESVVGSILLNMALTSSPDWDFLWDHWPHPMRQGWMLCYSALKVCISSLAISIVPVHCLSSM